MMNTHTQIFLNDVSTLGTRLRCVVWIYFYQLSVSVFCFTFKFLKEGNQTSHQFIYGSFGFAFGRSKKD